MPPSCCLDLFKVLRHRTETSSNLEFELLTTANLVSWWSWFQQEKALFSNGNSRSALIGLFVSRPGAECRFSRMSLTSESGPFWWITYITCVCSFPPTVSQNAFVPWSYQHPGAISESINKYWTDRSVRLAKLETRYRHVWIVHPGYFNMHALGRGSLLGYVTCRTRHR